MERERKQKIDHVAALERDFKAARDLLARSLAYVETDPPGHNRLAKEINDFLDRT